MEALLAFEGVTVQFGGLTALSEVSFGVQPGEVIGLIGPNGAGKTTLFNTVTGLVRPAKGDVTFNGTRISGWRPSRTAALGVARTFQTPRVFRSLTVARNIEAGLHTLTRESVLDTIIGAPRARAERRHVGARVAELLDYVGLRSRAQDLAGNLALPDLRRLEIARAMAAQPRLLMLDEPASGMDQADMRAVMGIVRNVHASGVTLLVIEHNMQVVMRLAQRIVVLDHGVKIAEGSPEAVQRDPRVIEAYLGQAVGVA